VQQLFLLTR